MLNKKTNKKFLLRIIFLIGLVVIDLIQPSEDNKSLEIESIDKSLHRMIYMHIPKTGV